MLKRFTPFFNLDGEVGGGWLETLSQDTPANDDQPELESDAEELEEEQPVDVDKADNEVDDPAPSDEEGKEDAPPLNDDTEIEIGEGQAVPLSELKQGYLRQSDYTKKTQTLAEERKTFEAEREGFAPVKGLADFLNGNPYLREQIQYFIREFTTTGVVPIDEALQDAQYGQYINTLMAQNESLNKQLQDLQGKYGDLSFGTEMDKTIAELKGEYGELITSDYEQQLRDQAKSENLKPDMVKRIAKGDLAEKKLQQNKKTAKEIEAETIQNIQEKRNSLPSQPKSKGQKPNSSLNVDDMSWGQLLQG